SIVVLTLLPKKLLNKTSELQLDPIEISALPPKNSLTKTIKLIEFQLDFIEVLSHNDPLSLSSKASGSKNHHKLIIEEQGLKRRNDNISGISKLPQLNEKDAIILNKVMQYSQKAFKEILIVKETIIHMETTIIEFINDQTI
ncbi:8450_t:CDS:2, partial [Funneliformis geosporum]